MAAELPDTLPSYSVQQDTPDGRMFVHISEHNGMPVDIRINIGKAGTNLNAWGEACARLVTRLLPKIGVHGVIEELSGITSSGLKVLEKGGICRSGPEGIALALLKYRKQKYKENRPARRSGAATVGEG